MNATANTEIGPIQGVGRLPEQSEPSTAICRCHHCGSTDWIWYTTTSIRLQTAARELPASDTGIIAREFRCAGCGGKAVAKQVKEIVATQAYAEALEIEKGRIREAK